MPTEAEIQQSIERARKRRKRKLRPRKVITKRAVITAPDGKIRTINKRIWIVDTFLDELPKNRRKEFVLMSEMLRYYSKHPRRNVFAVIDLLRFIPVGSPGTENTVKDRGQWAFFRVQTKVVQTTREFRLALEKRFDELMEQGPEKGRLVLLMSAEVEKFDVRNPIPRRFRR